MLEKIADGFWLTEGEIVSFYGFLYPTRSVIARFDNGDLWVWSPVKLTDALRAHVDGLGRVAHLVSPNKIHHLYLAAWKAAYPDANLWGPESTIRRHPELQFREPLQDTAPPEWQPDIDQAWFRGSFAMDEIVFLHRPSRTVIVADLIEAFSDQFLRQHWPWWQRPLAALDGIIARKALPPLEWRLSFRDRKPARAARSKGPRLGLRTGHHGARGVAACQWSRLPEAVFGLAWARRPNRLMQQDYAGGGPNTRTALRPPKAKLFDMA